MRPSELLNDKTIPNEEKFCLFLKWERIEAKLSVTEMAKKLEMPAELLSSYENSQYRIPTKHLNKMIEVFEISGKDVDDFYDLAGVATSNWSDLNEYLADMPNARKLIRVLRERELPAEEIDRMIDYLSRENVRQ